MIMKTKFYQTVFLSIATLALTSCGGNARTASAEETAAKETAAKEVAVKLMDYGNDPTVLDIEAFTLGNDNFRTALWTGTYLQVTLMSIPIGGDVGLEQHLGTDQFLRIEDGQGRVQMGNTKDNLNYFEDVVANYAILVPAGKWHNITNTGNKPLKLYSIYAPVDHPFGTIEKTQAEAMAAEQLH